MKTINIMTSCDNNIAQLIMPQLASIGINLANYHVNFYLTHYRISRKNIEALKTYAKTISNITFHEVLIENVDIFNNLAQHGGRFPAEAYFYLYCHNLFPNDMDRILYIDAADVIIHGDISEYYFDDFEDNSFIISLEMFAELDENGTIRPLVTDDLENPNHVNIIRQAYVNSGCIVLNLNKLRAIGDEMLTRYHYWAEKLLNMELPPIQKSNELAYLGDQGLLGVAFMGDMKAFGFKNIIQPTMHTYELFNSGQGKYISNLYRPYNFSQWFYNSSWYTPIVLHYASPLLKPWNYENGDVRNADLKNHRQEEMHKIWWAYWQLTPLNKAKNNNTQLLQIKNISQLNAISYMAEFYLTEKKYEESKKLISKLDNDFLYAGLILKLLTATNQMADALKIADDYINNNACHPYTLISIYYYKGLCCYSLKDYNKAISAYKAGLYHLQQYLLGKYDAYVPLIFPDYNLPMSKWLFEHNLSQCYVILNEYDKAFNCITSITDGNNVKDYFRLINESGCINQIQVLFEKIKKSPNIKECITSFNEIVLPHPNALEVLAPFLEDYVTVVHEHIKNTPE